MCQCSIYLYCQQGVPGRNDVVIDFTLRPKPFSKAPNRQGCSFQIIQKYELIFSENNISLEDIFITVFDAYNGIIVIDHWYLLTLNNAVYILDWDIRSNFESVRILNNDRIRIHLIAGSVAHLCPVPGIHIPVNNNGVTIRLKYTVPVGLVIGNLPVNHSPVFRKLHHSRGIQSERDRIGLQYNRLSDA